ncbi:hypothetical protein DPMN_093085 [Dreissena polymorpha]|uniref:Uncharacterized protein n=1 Tax=Dreissena polymorpha TaxID=45954 RepID=A0A9D4L3B3_DREPO|nr:hypothetical protein DPMN_093085 [Dreissena polymorpha]
MATGQYDHHHTETTGLHQHLPQTGQTRSLTKNYGEEQSSSQLKKTNRSQAWIQYDKAISHIEPQRKKAESRPRITWRRDQIADAKQMEQTLGQLEILAQNRDAWRKLFGGPDGATGKDVLTMILKLQYECDNATVRQHDTDNTKEKKI